MVFLNLKEKYCTAENSLYHILSVPFDKTSTYLKGADKGPAAIIDASAYMELYDIETDSEAYKKGIYTDKFRFDVSSSEKMVKSVNEKITEKIKANVLPIVLGGEHSVSIGAIEAMKAQYSDLTVLQFDAHSDMQDEYKGSRFNHACVMARAKDFGANVVQCGIRAVDYSEYKNIDREKIFYAENIFNNENWMEKAIAKLSDSVYISFDLDVFDPAIMPSTGTPEPGGLSWYSVLKFLSLVIERRKLVGFDIVELCPNGNKHAEFLAAKLVYKIISYHNKSMEGKK